MLDHQVVKDKQKSTNSAKESATISTINLSHAALA